MRYDGQQQMCSYTFAYVNRYITIDGVTTFLPPRTFVGDYYEIGRWLWHLAVKAGWQ